MNVTATRSGKAPIDIPAAVERVDKAAIQNATPTLTLDESLSGIPGLFFQNRFNFAQDLRLAIRGFGARSPFGMRGVKVLVDEIPETLPDGQTEIDALDPGIIDHIEVMRGPSSALYGNAAGGVISVATEDGAESGREVSPGFVAGGFGLLKEQVKFSGTENNAQFRVYASRMEIDGFRDHAAAENSLVQGKLRLWTDSRSDWTFNIGYFDSPRAEDPGALTREEADANPKQASGNHVLFSAGEKVEQRHFGVRYRKNLSERHELAVTAYWRRRDFANKLPFVSGGLVEFSREVPGLGVKSVYDGDVFGFSNRLIAGIDGSWQRDDRQRYDNMRGIRGGRTLDQVEEVMNIGPYARDELRLSERLDIVAGWRYDHTRFRVADSHRADGDQSGSRVLAEWSGTIGAVFHVDAATHWYGSMATAFETPTAAEFSNNPSGLGGFNPDLRSQDSVSYETGVKGNAGRDCRYELAAFFVRSRNEIAPFEIADFPGRTFYRNAAKSERRGVELAARARPARGLDAAFSYAFSDFRFAEFAAEGVDLSGRDIPGIPNHRGQAQLDYKHADGFFAHWETVYTGGFYVNNENDRSNRAYTLSHARFGMEKDLRSVRWSVFLGANNVFDARYAANARINAAGGRYFEPGSPFDIYGGVSLVYAHGGADRAR